MEPHQKVISGGRTELSAILTRQANNCERSKDIHRSVAAQNRRGCCETAWTGTRARVLHFDAPAGASAQSVAWFDAAMALPSDATIADATNQIPRSAQAL